MKARMEKPTAEDVARHLETGALYPLKGTLVMPDGGRRIVEFLNEGPGEPKYEVHAEKGRVLVDGAHSHLCFDMKDVFGWGCEKSVPDMEEVTA